MRGFRDAHELREENDWTHEECVKLLREQGEAYLSAAKALANIGEDDKLLCDLLDSAMCAFKALDTAEEFHEAKALWHFHAERDYINRQGR